MNTGNADVTFSVMLHSVRNGSHGGVKVKHAHANAEHIDATDVHFGQNSVLPSGTTTLRDCVDEVAHASPSARATHLAERIRCHPERSRRTSNFVCTHGAA